MIDSICNNKSPYKPKGILINNILGGQNANNVNKQIDPFNFSNKSENVTNSERVSVSVPSKTATESPHIDSAIKFWLEDPAILFRNNNYTKIVPSKQMNRIEVLNALSRFFIYLIIIYLIFSVDWTYMLIPMAGIVIILFLYVIQKWHTGELVQMETFNAPSNEDKIITPETGNTYQLPTTDNPFMNVTMADLMDNRTRLSAGPVTDPIIKNKINQAYKQNLFTDVEDVFGRGHAQRQFYTMPSTTIPNDQTGFAKWVYSAPETCKENQLNCLKYEDIRFSRFSPNIDIMSQSEE